MNGKILILGTNLAFFGGQLHPGAAASLLARYRSEFTPGECTLPRAEKNFLVRFLEHKNARKAGASFMIEQGYDFYLADTDAGKSIHYRLRYQVYCLQKRYEDPNLHPNFLERDSYDDMAVHFIARCRVTGTWLGTMRLVVGPIESLPLAKYTTPDLPRNGNVEYAKLAEASRLCTTLPFQNKSEFRAASINGSRAVATRALHASMVTIGLIRAARRYSLQHGIVTCLFVITDSFARVLKRLGMEIEPIGSPCQYRGWRRPYAHNFVTGYRQMEVRSPELYKTFCQPNAYSYYSQIEAVETLPLAAMA